MGYSIEINKIIQSHIIVAVIQLIIPTLSNLQKVELQKKLHDHAIAQKSVIKPILHELNLNPLGF